MDSINTSKTFGPLEAAVIARLSYEGSSIVTVEELDNLFSFKPETRRQVVFRLKKKKVLIPIKRGVYFFTPLEEGPSGKSVDEFLIPPVFFPEGNYYIGYSTMFSYYGFSEQEFQTVYVINSSRRMRKTICGIQYKFIRVKPERLYGSSIIKIQDIEVNISSKERTMVDLLYFSNPVGGIQKASAIFESTVEKGECSPEKLVSNAVRFPNITVRKRIGVILDRLGYSDDLLHPLAESIIDTAVSSLGPLRRGTLNRKWRVIEQ